MSQDVAFCNRDKYPLSHVDLRKMNKIIRHRLRNLCAGVKMTMEKVSSLTAQSQPQVAERCALIIEEMDNLREFTDRMDSLFDKMPPPEKMSLFDILCLTREFFIKKFPFCHLDLEGEELGVVLNHGSWFPVALREIVLNAGEAAGAGGSVKLAWAKNDGAVSITVSNTGEPPPSEIPLAPPMPFNTLKSRHDGMGMAIAKRICEEAGAGLEVRVSAGAVAVEIKFPPEEFANG